MHFDSIVDVSFFLGIGVGFGLAIDPLYISEITPASHRGEIVTWSEIAINVGVVLGFCSGIIFYDVDDSLEWRLMFLMGCILPLIVILVSQYIMPESPRWLVSKDRTEEAKVILRNIYPNNQHQQIETVIRDIQEALQREQLAENTMGWTMLLCPTPAIRRMLLVGIGMAISQQAVGIDAIQYYLIEIIASAGMESDKAQLGVLIILGVLKLMFVVIASKVVDKRGRKPLLLLSLAGTLLVYSLHFPLASLVVYMCVYIIYSAKYSTFSIPSFFLTFHYYYSINP